MFVEWDPSRSPSASIGQVHRAVVVDPATGEERAVAVKVQYPGVGEAIEADLANTDLLGTLLRQGFGGLDPTEMVAEIKERVTEELDYRREAANQTALRRLLPRPPVHPRARRAAGALDRAGADQRARRRRAVAGGADVGPGPSATSPARRSSASCSAASTGCRRSTATRIPGNYLFHGDGRITFLDFGLVRYFTDAEMKVFASMVEAAAVDHDAAAFRRIVEDAGLLRPGAPVPTDEVGDYFSQFYEPVADRPRR